MHQAVPLELTGLIATEQLLPLFPDVTRSRLVGVLGRDLPLPWGN